MTGRQASHGAAQPRTLLLDEIEQLAFAVGGGSVSNPCYFALMLAGTVSATEGQELLALEELRDAMARIMDRRGAAPHPGMIFGSAALFERALAS